MGLLGGRLGGAPLPQDGPGPGERLSRTGGSACRRPCSGPSRREPRSSLRRGAGAGGSPFRRILLLLPGGSSRCDGRSVWLSASDLRASRCPRDGAPPPRRSISGTPSCSFLLPESSRSVDSGGLPLPAAGRGLLGRWGDRRSSADCRPPRSGRSPGAADGDRRQGGVGR